MPRRPPETLSLRSPAVQRVRALVRHAKERRHQRAFVVEGSKVVGEALAAGAALEGLFVTAGCDDPVVDAAREAGVPVHPLAPGVVERVAGAVTPQPVLAVAAALDVTADDLGDDAMVLVAAGVADPGNLGTLLRAAEAAGAGGVVCCPPSADVYSPKTVRASAGALFHIPIVLCDAGDALDALRARQYRRLAASVAGAPSYDEVDLRGRVAVVLGNEAHGIAPELLGAVDGAVTIPMAGRTESLNVAMAATLLAFEAARQRRTAA